MGVLRWGLAMPIVLLAAIGLINRHPGLLWLIPAGAVLFFLASLLWAYISTREPVRRASQEAARREAALADREALRRMAP